MTATILNYLIFNMHRPTHFVLSSGPGDTEWTQGSQRRPTLCGCFVSVCILPSTVFCPPRAAISCTYIGCEAWVFIRSKQLSFSKAKKSCSPSPLRPTCLRRPPFCPPPLPFPYVVTPMPMLGRAPRLGCQDDEPGPRGHRETTGEGASWLPRHLLGRGGPGHAEARPVTATEEEKTRTLMCCSVSTTTVYFCFTMALWGLSFLPGGRPCFFL